jgi:hypothetical protein
VRPKPGASKGNSNPYEDFVLCPVEDCGEHMLVADLNDHLDFHDVQLASLDEDSSLSLAQQSDSDKHSSGHSSSSSSHFNTDLDPALRRKDKPGGTRRKMDRDSDDASRAHIGRKFLSIFNSDRRGREHVPSKKAPLGMQRLGQAELGEFFCDNIDLHTGSQDDRNMTMSHPNRSKSNTVLI